MKLGEASAPGKPIFAYEDGERSGAMGENSHTAEKNVTYTASTALLDALQQLDVDYIFANFGSDHPAIIESIAAARAVGKPMPNVITCPNEMVGMSAAHGFAAATGRAQAVRVHVECGTQALAGAVRCTTRQKVGFPSLFSPAPRLSARTAR